MWASSGLHVIYRFFLLLLLLFFYRNTIFQEPATLPLHVVVIRGSLSLDVSSKLPNSTLTSSSSFVIINHTPWLHHNTVQDCTLRRIIGIPKAPSHKTWGTLQLSYKCTKTPGCFLFKTLPLSNFKAPLNNK